MRSIKTRMLILPFLFIGSMASATAAGQTSTAIRDITVTEMPTSSGKESERMIDICAKTLRSQFELMKLEYTRLDINLKDGVLSVDDAKVAEVRKLEIAPTSPIRADLLGKLQEVRAEQKKSAADLVEIGVAPRIREICNPVLALLANPSSQDDSRKPAEQANRTVIYKNIN